LAWIAFGSGYFGAVTDNAIPDATRVVQSVWPENPPSTVSGAGG
jgi:hypothetical protein